MSEERDNQINDCFVDVYGRPPRASEIHAIAQLMPLEIKELALRWGWHDTEVREKLYAYLKEDFE